jgi:phosphomannomutase
MPESQIQIKEAVVKNQADFGVIFDGDTDRLFFVDENGRFVQADKTLLVLAREFLNREPGAGIVYNAICSKIVSEKIIEWGGRPIISKVGFVNIMHAMAEQQGIMGGELSAHYSFRDNGYADSGFIAWLILLQLLSEDGRKLSEIVEEFNIYHKIDEINIAIDDPKRGEVIAKLKNTYKNGKQSDFDGLTISFENWWFNVRKSNTEPLLRVTIETQNEQMTEEKKQELLTIIEN